MAILSRDFPMLCLFLLIDSGMQDFESWWAPQSVVVYEEIDALTIYQYIIYVIIYVIPTPSGLRYYDS